EDSPLGYENPNGHLDQHANGPFSTIVGYKRRKRDVCRAARHRVIEAALRWWRPTTREVLQREIIQGRFKHRLWNECANSLDRADCRSMTPVSIRFAGSANRISTPTM